MVRRSDCIYCGGDTGSREHTFPAALGGRRMNKGILCEACNNKFAPLDALLAQQLSVFNGLIGVRPDRADDPRPARVESKDGPILIDSAGKPAFAEPRVLFDETQPDGRRLMGVRFGSERQEQEWLAQQRAAGLNIKRESRSEGQGFLSEEAIHIEWSFGGNDAFREIGRIALNFLAHRMPDLARVPELKPFKEFVEGRRSVQEGDPRPVWFAPPAAFAVPESSFPFGHQVVLFSDDAAVFARVRFFSTFDLFVWFGSLPDAPSEVVFFDIDPLAEHPPDDLVVKVLPREEFTEVVIPPTSDPLDLADLLKKRTVMMLQRVDTHQWTISTKGLLDALNATRSLPFRDREARVAELLFPHRGRVLFLARHFAYDFRSRVEDEAMRFFPEAVEAIVAHDPQSPDGLSEVARITIRLALQKLAEVLAKELKAGPMTDERLRLLLAGKPGAQIVGTVVSQLVIGTLRGMV